MSLIGVCGVLILSALLRASRGVQPAGNFAQAALLAVSLFLAETGFVVAGFCFFCTALLLDYALTLVARKWSYEKEGIQFRARKEVLSGVCYCLLAVPLGAAVMFGPLPVSMLAFAVGIGLGFFIDRYRKLWGLPPRP
ncbi:hypothetical protein [Paraburkholderia fungorum]|uniref:Phosphatidate cytidylyltransferase n=1 Tax=Paraburkholderia fungorum TaxID=134537 RepID=A0AAW3V4R8_9BURK|nr:hypothetical protein [Paraburkholderia fungorum]MBB4517316.1 hypothetical protein [Paraburkholderia fungorum]MBB6204385.1 hypothetical protein [Paraburkholderia fungorum]